MDSYKKEGIDLVYLKVEQRASPPTPSGCGLTDKILRIKTNMLKTFIVGLVIVALMGAALEYGYNSDAEVMIIEKEVTEDGTKFTDQDAIEAAENVLHRKALEAELSGLESNFEATTATFQADKSWYEGEKERIEKELGTY